MQPWQDRWKCRKTPQDGAEKPQGLRGGGGGGTRRDGWAHWKVPLEPNPAEGKQRTTWLPRAPTAVSSGNTEDEGSVGRVGLPGRGAGGRTGPSKEQQGARGHWTGLAAALGTRRTPGREGVV